MGEKQIGRLIVADTGPLLRLEEIQAWRLLQPFAPVQVPRLVVEECKRLKVPLNSEWVEPLHESPPQDSMQRVLPIVASGVIQPAEAEAIAWCLSTAGSLILTDDAAARSIAESIGIEAHGSVGILLYNVVAREIGYEDGLRMLSDLATSSLWVSRRVLEQAERTLRELCRE